MIRRVGWFAYFASHLTAWLLRTLRVSCLLLLIVGAVCWSGDFQLLEAPVLYEITVAGEPWRW